MLLRHSSVALSTVTSPSGNSSDLCQQNLACVSAARSALGLDCSLLGCETVHVDGLFWYRAEAQRSWISLSMSVACVDAALKVLHPMQAVIQLMAQADLATCRYI